MPQSTIVKILRKFLCLWAYKVQIVLALQPNDLLQRATFAAEILDRTDADND